MLLKKSLLCVSVTALLAGVSHTVLADDIEHVEIRAQRMASDLNSIARNVSVIDEQMLRTQFSSAQNIAEVLAKTVPGMAPPTPALTNFGTTLRGRNALVLIDGVPMNTNRNISRDLHNLHPAQVERVEIFRGGNALYGSGATGGVIYIYTKGGQQASEIASSIEVKNGAYTLAQSFVGQVNDWQYRVGASYENVDSFSDADGDRIAVEPSQGDSFDSDIYSFDAKVSKTWDAQSLSLSVLSYVLEQDTDYASDPTVKALPYINKAQSIKGLQLDKQNQINNLVFNVGYQNQLSENNKLSAQFYFRDYDARFAPFDGRPYATWNHLAQTYLESTNLGLKLTVNSQLSENLELDWGFDAQDERSEMPVTTYDGEVYDNSGYLVFKETGDKAFVPEISHRTLAAFAQARANVTEQLGVEAGLRAERIDASFDDFTTLGQAVAISGSSYDYSSTVYNLGVTYDINDNHTVYVAFNEGYELPDIGLQIRYASSQFDLSQSSLQPIESTDREIGWRGELGSLSFSAAYFVSKSDLGRVKSEGMGLSISRNQVEIDGFEIASSWDMTNNLSMDLSYSKANGDEKAQNAEQFQQMNGFSIAPSKLTAQLNYDLTSSWRTNLTFMHSGSKDYRLEGENAFGRRDVESYTLVDFNSQIELEQGTVTVGIENLFNNQYFPVYSQLQRNGNNSSSIPGRGRTFSVKYRIVW
ncbi:MULTISPECIES: TonB-dependent receptor [Pseudoalteromonas]|uniref:TonB-dependent receptor n=1 Tax=Pseudoalteromonas amylolytica TaxID=1859457 RepID=A0A1S1MT78_9GAMM|nr:MULTISPECIES: TonB-dependent receptor [Pseudoalteromonas]OHU86904.1 TonB-dependent receptor [Pseudoalteromonas sp. JW3]OHU88387.1 TonB-dependent receptor [Pseudoalteromonas amylolytica]